SEALATSQRGLGSERQGPDVGLDLDGFRLRIDLRLIIWLPRRSRVERCGRLRTARVLNRLFARLAARGLADGRRSVLGTTRVRLAVAGELDRRARNAIEH